MTERNVARRDTFTNLLKPDDIKFSVRPEIYYEEGYNLFQSSDEETINSLMKANENVSKKIRAKGTQTNQQHKIQDNIKAIQTIQHHKMK